MNRREFLGRLINYYTIAATTNEPYGMYVPYNYKSNLVSTTAKWVYGTNSGSIVAIYDSKGTCVFSNAVTTKPPTVHELMGMYIGNYNYTTIGGKNCYYLKWDDGVLPPTYLYYLPVVKPGIYTSKVIYSGAGKTPQTQEIQFEVKQLEKRKNYGLEEGYVVELDHGFEKDSSNPDGIFYYDIPATCVIYR